MRPAPLLSAAVLTLAACGGDPAAPDPSATGGTRVEGSADLVVGEAGVGPLGAETPFDTAAVRAALASGFTTELRSVETARGLVPVVWALRDGQLVLELYADPSGARVGRVDAPNEAVSGPGGARVGQTFADVGGADMDCEAGTDELSGRAVCRGDDRGVLYVFASQQTLGPDLPPAEALTDALLERLVWRADGG
ncbi:MAG TPA: DUF1131 family protein [Rubricoccaceae bacterium]|jgi:hypothetical protein